MPDFNELPYSLHSQGDNGYFIALVVFFIATGCLFTKIRSQRSNSALSCRDVLKSLGEWPGPYLTSVLVDKGLDLDHNFYLVEKDLQTRICQ